MAIDQLRRTCSIVLHDDRVSTDDVLCGSNVLPPGVLAKLSASGATPIYILAAASVPNHDEVSIHISLAQRFGLDNRAKATVQILEANVTGAATATHIEFFFRDQHLSRADMWRIMQRLDGTVVYQGQKVNYLGSLAAEIRAVYVSGKEVSSAYVTHAKTKPIFRSAAKGSMLEAIHMAAMDFANDNVDPQLSCRGTSIIAITAGAELFETNHEMLKSTTNLLMANSIGIDIVAMSPKPLHPVPLFSYQRDGAWEYALPHWVDISFWEGQEPDYMASWLLPRPTDVVSITIPPTDIHTGNLDGLVTSKMDDYDQAVFGDHHLPTRASLTFVKPELLTNAGPTTHDRDLLANPPFPPDESSSGIAKKIRKSLARKASQQSMTSQPSALLAVPSKPIDIQPGQQVPTEDEADPTSMIEHNVLDAVPEAGAAGVSETPTAKNDMFYTAMKAAEEEGHWTTSPWLTLLNPCNPTRDNMRVAVQYRKWQHIFPRAVRPTEFKWASMCSPAALPLTTEYKPSVRELQKHFTKKVRRLLLQQGADHGRLGSNHAFSQLIKLRLAYGFQLSTTEQFQSGNGQSDSSARVLMSLGNTHHELQCLSDAELQVVEYSLDEIDTAQARENVEVDTGYHMCVRSAFHTSTINNAIKLTAMRSEPAWSRLDQQVIAHDSSHVDSDVTRMRLVLIPVEPPRPGHVTPGPSRGLSDEERHIDGIQKLTQFWQRNRYTTPEDRRQQASLLRLRTTPMVAPRDPNPLSIEYQTRDPSAIANAYGPALTSQLDSSEQAAPLFPESEMYHSSSFDVTKLVKQMQEPPPHGVEVRDRRWFARLHFKCFRGDEMVNWLLRVFRDLQTREDALAIGKDLMDRGVFSHVRAKHEFRDGNYFYQIASIHRTTGYPDNASMFGRGSLRSVPSTPIAETRSSPFMRPLREDGASSGRPTPTMAPSDKKQLLLSEQMLYNVDPAKKSDQLEIISLHYDRIHNPENCYHILLEWVSATAVLVREATNRWTTLAESHGLKLIQVPIAEASKLRTHHIFDQPISVKLALRPPEKIPMTPVLDGQPFGMQPAADSLAYQKALLRKMDFVLDFEAAASFTTKMEVLYSYGKPDYDMTQYIHKSGLLLAQVCGDGSCDFLLVPNRLATSRASAAGRPLIEAEAIEDTVKRFVSFCRDGKALKTFFEETNRPPPSPSSDGQKNILNWVDPKDKTGEFKRQQSTFRDWVSSEEGAEFPAEKGRYHLYVSYACPWAHRTLIVRKLKGLEDIIPFTSVHWHMLEKGWRFATADGEAPGENVRPDPIHPDFTHIRDIYFENYKDYGGRFTVPTLYDTKQKRIVNNESSEIIRMFYHAFDKSLPEKYAKLDLLPEDLKESIEATNEWTYNDVNNGVYKSGFATTQEAYEKNVRTLFTALDRAEADLSRSPGPYYHGAHVTEADVRLYPTIIRFDAVYVHHFKCNLRDIRSGYPNLHKWVRYCYWKNEAFGGTTEFTHIKSHYTKSHRQINPLSITPLGPEVNILPMDEEVPAVKAALKK
ncbi:hypothetical protein B0A55_04817 [Friedmanniomyces simplex]|uniref:Vacuolar membrane-associated protein IML1 n=1 Tax=Friedmanniomyces simplex TaxID=329884 RepID=A0A4U0XPQ3_9PEZI|nr:hypothetical protein B0A55_04817 [Friedmanniomyces simplex]